MSERLRTRIGEPLAEGPERHRGAGSRRWTQDGLAMVCGAVLAALMLGRDGSSLAAGFATLWWMAVVVVVRSDLERFIIPDWTSGSIFALGLAYGVTQSEVSGENAEAAGVALAAALLNAGLVFGLFWLIGRLYRRASGRDGLGFGDVKLAGASAVWLAPGDAAVALEIAALAALAILLVSRRQGRLRDVAVPFGAFLAPAAWLTFVAGPWLHALMDGVS